MHISMYLCVYIICNIRYPKSIYLFCLSLKLCMRANHYLSLKIQFLSTYCYKLHHHRTHTVDIFVCVFYVTFYSLYCVALKHREKYQKKKKRKTLCITLHIQFSSIFLRNVSSNKTFKIDQQGSTPTHHVTLGKGRPPPCLGIPVSKRR